MKKHSDDELYPMAQLPKGELYLFMHLSSWLPPVVGATGEQLEHIAREAARQYLEEGAC